MNWELKGSDAQVDWPNWNSAWFNPDRFGQAMLDSDKPPWLNSNEYTEAGWTARNAANAEGGAGPTGGNHFFGGFWTNWDSYAKHVGQHLKMCGSTIS